MKKTKIYDPAIEKIPYGSYRYVFDEKRQRNMLERIEDEDDK